MTLSNLLMTAYVNKASEAGKGVFDILDEVATNYFYGEIYKQAAGLFDPGTTLDLGNEYHRGVTELVMRFTGTDSDDKDDVESIISGLTLGLRYFASEWARTHGTHIYEGISADIQTWARGEEHRVFTEDELDTILNLLEGAKIVL